MAKTSTKTPAKKAATTRTVVARKPISAAIAGTHESPSAVKGSEPFKPSRGTPLIEMKDISIAFGGIKAVDHASID